MKRLGNVFDELVSIENLRLAYNNAKRGKSGYREIRELDRCIETKLYELRNSLIDGTYKVSDYKTEVRFVGKQRKISKLPFYPDRIVHHALIQAIGERLTRSFISQTHHCIPGRGCMSMNKQIRSELKQINSKNLYALKIDIKKFYESIDNNILMREISRLIKCKLTIDLIQKIVYSHKGLPIGNYTSVYFANVYLNRFDWWCKQNSRSDMYFRYADDILFVHRNKNKLKQIFNKISKYLISLNLEIKNTFQYADIINRSILFCGVHINRFRFFMTNLHKRALIRSRNLFGNFPTYQKLCSYQSRLGWAKSTGTYKYVQVTT